MTQGLLINGKRPKSKKQIKEYVADAYDKYSVGDLRDVHIESTSFFGDEYGGPLSELPQTDVITFVGPDPSYNRKFYGTLRFNQKKSRWVVT